MTPEAIQAIENFAIDALKILGPAIVAAVVAYKVAKAQFEATLKQTDKRNEFDARKAVYDFLIQRQEKLGENFKQMGENLGYVLGLTTGVAEDDEDFLTFIDLSNLTLRTIRRECGVSKDQYEKKGLTDKPQYKIIEACTEKANALEAATTYDSLRYNSLELMPIYEDLHYALDALIDWEMEEILAPYIEHD